MSRRLCAAGILSVLLAAPSAFAAEDARTRDEVVHLLDYLGRSGCQFNRNGTWYSSVKAKAHLARKLEYLLDRKFVESPEQFIALAGTKSSQSGEEYQVKCGNEAAVSSAAWLTAQLKELREKNSQGAAEK